MAIHRLNHAVLYVRNVARSVAFYRDVLGFDGIEEMGSNRGAAFLRAPGSTNDHDLGLFEIGDQAGDSQAGRGDGRAVPPGLGGRHAATTWSSCASRLAAAGALVGASDHSTTKSLYGKDPDGLEFEIAWIVPADALDEAAIAGRATRSGRSTSTVRRPATAPTTPGGIGISRRARGPLTPGRGLTAGSDRVRLTAKEAGSHKEAKPCSDSSSR